MQTTRPATFFRTFLSFLLLYAFIISLCALPLTKSARASATGKAGHGNSHLPPSIATAVQEPEKRSGELLVVSAQVSPSKAKMPSWRRRVCDERKSCAVS